MFGFGKKQWVCTQCGYNVVGPRPKTCPFCGARKHRLLDSATATKRFHVKEKKVSDTVTQLYCEPRLGLAQSAYRIVADGGPVWIDCPSVFDSKLPAVDSILFTHKDFIGAANQYRQQWDAEVWLHGADAELSQVCQHSVTERFTGDIETHGVRGLHIGGHTPGFTVYIWQGVLFLCDYVYPPGADMKLNPHGERDATLAGASRLAGIVSREPLTTVCGYNYVCDFPSWQQAFMKLI